MVHEAKDLIAADPNGYSDPYAVLTVGTKQSKTSVRDKTLDPIWNEGFDFDFSATKVVVVTLWDKDLISADDFLGQTVVDVSQIPVGGAAVWRALESRPGKSDKVKGVVRISIQEASVANAEAFDHVSVSSTVKSRLQIAKKDQVTVLDVSGCNLTDLPTAIIETPVWTSIDLGFNRFVAFPEAVTVCAVTLTELLLSGNQLTQISAKIGKLINLKTLYLNGNQLTDLPVEIGDLEALEKLDASNNGLRSLPASIGRLTRLEELNLSGSKFLDGLPTEIGGLDFLVSFHLNACELRELPASLPQLDRLLELDLGTNALTQLPNDMGNLTRLVTLNLSDNQLTDLPLSMGHCLKLDQCQLERNPIHNEDLLRKYRVGTDHLVDYLEKRLFAFEQEQKRRKKTADKKAKKRPPIPRDRPSLLDEEESITIANQIEEDPDEALPLEERMTKKKYGAQQVAHKTRQELVDLKKALMMAKTVEETVPIAQAIRDLKAFCEEARSSIMPCDRPKPPPLFPNETKLQQLKKVTMVAMKEVEIVTSGITNTLSAKITHEQIEALARLSGQIQNRLQESMAQIKQASASANASALASDAPAD